MNTIGGTIGLWFGALLIGLGLLAIVCGALTVMNEPGSREVPIAFIGVVGGAGMVVVGLIWLGVLQYFGI
jgi:hypothetical protein